MSAVSRPEHRTERLPELPELIDTPDRQLTDTRTAEWSLQCGNELCGGSAAGHPAENLG